MTNLLILTEKCGQPLIDQFDLIIGTSTGAVLSALMGYKGQTPEKSQHLYKEFASAVFKIGSGKEPSTMSSKDASAWTKLANYTQMLSTGAFYSCNFWLFLHKSSFSYSLPSFFIYILLFIFSQNS